MDDPSNKPSADKPQQNRQGRVFAPKPLERRWGAVVVLLALGAPLFVLFGSWSPPFSPLVLDKLPMFKVLVSQKVFSVDQLARTEIWVIVVLLAELAGAPHYFTAEMRKYSKQHPPPQVLKEVWPKQLCLGLGFGAFFLSGLFIIGVSLSAGFLSDLSSIRYVIAPPTLLTLGVLMLADVATSSALYVYFYFKYWRSSV
jgi:hypothetical protein